MLASCKELPHYNLFLQHMPAPKKSQRHPSLEDASDLFQDNFVSRGVEESSHPFCRTEVFPETAQRCVSSDKTQELLPLLARNFSTTGKRGASQTFGQISSADEELWDCNWSWRRKKKKGFVKNKDPAPLLSQISLGPNRYLEIILTAPLTTASTKSKPQGRSSNTKKSASGWPEWTDLGPSG